MALFTDGPLSSMEELTAQDTQLANVANVEGIDLTRKLSLAQEELALELATLLNGSQRAEQAFWIAPQPTIQNVVATPALKLWHTFRTLEMVYRDAYSSQLNDRYAAKRDQFKERAKWACEKLLLLGIGVVGSPIPRAAVPQVVIAEGGLPDGTYYVSIGWTNREGEEGAPSEATAISTTACSLLVQPPAPPDGAVAWNVYVGTDPEALWLQNGTPMAATETWLQPSAVAIGRTPGSGQTPAYVMPMPRRILRG